MAPEGGSGVAWTAEDPPQAGAGGDSPVTSVAGEQLKQKLLHLRLRFFPKHDRSGARLQPGE